MRLNIIGAFLWSICGISTAHVLNAPSNNDRQDEDLFSLNGISNR
jgi:hypothetical protein